MDTLSIGSMIKILSEAIGQRANRDCKEFNLTMQQMKVLHFLKTREGKELSSQKDIQDYMKISHPTTVNILRLMKEKGFIETFTSEEDKRMRIVRLTGKEEGFVKSIISRKEEMDKQLLQGLTQEEQNNLKQYLRKMYDNIVC